MPLLKRINRTLQKKIGIMGLRIKRLKSLKANPTRRNQLEQIYTNKTKAKLNRTSAKNWSDRAVKIKKRDFNNLAVREANKNLKAEENSDIKVKETQSRLKRQRKRI